MRIDPVLFNYKKMKEQVPNLEIIYGRKNVILKNEQYTMWGENVDAQEGIMKLTSISLSREYYKGKKHDIYDEWASFLHQFANLVPKEIQIKLKRRDKRIG